MANDVVSTLAFQIVADTKQFTSGMTATKKEIKEAAQIMEQAQSPLKAFAGEIAHLNTLHDKGLISTSAYTGAVSKLVAEYTSGVPVLGKFTHVLAAGGPAAIAVAVAIGTIGAAVAAASAAIKVFNARAHEQYEVIDAIGNAAENLDILPVHFQAIQHAAHLADVEFANIQSGVQAMLVAISKAAHGEKKFLPTFQRLGLDPESLSRMGVEKSFRIILDAMQNLETHADKAAIAKKIFGDINFVRLGTEAIDAAADRISQLGSELSQLDVAQYDEMEKIWKEFHHTIELIWMRLAKNLMPGFIELGKVLEEVAIEIGTSQTLTQMLSDAGVALRVIVKLFERIYQIHRDMVANPIIQFSAQTAAAALGVNVQAMRMAMNDMRQELARPELKDETEDAQTIASAAKAELEDSELSEDLKELAQKQQDAFDAANLNRDIKQAEDMRRRMADVIFDDQQRMHDEQVKAAKQEADDRQRAAEADAKRLMEFRNPAAVRGSQAEHELLEGAKYQEESLRRQAAIEEWLKKIADNTDQPPIRLPIVADI